MYILYFFFLNYNMSGFKNKGIDTLESAMTLTI